MFGLASPPHWGHAGSGSAARMVTSSQGYDVPLHKVHYDNPIWKTIGPPKGGQYNYPVRGDEKVMICGWPAPPNIAASIYTQALIPNLVAKVTAEGVTSTEAIRWGTNELEGFMRG